MSSGPGDPAVSEGHQAADMTSHEVGAPKRQVGAQPDGQVRAKSLARLAELEVDTQDFDNPALEWRRLFSDFLGTFLRVLAGAGGAVVNAKSHGAISRTAAVTAPALTVMAVILFMGTISGAHLNPAVSLGFAARGDFPWKRLPRSIVM